MRQFDPASISPSHLNELASRYFHRAAPEDLASLSDADQQAIIANHGGLLGQRLPRVVNVRVYNPDPAAHGWSSTCSVIDIVVDDMPFLVDSVMMVLAQHRLKIHRSMHPVVGVVREPDGRLQELRAGRETPTGFSRESLMHFEVDRLTEAAERDAVAIEIRAVLDNVSSAVHDWRAMKARMIDIIPETRALSGHSQDDLDEAVAFCHWVESDNFVLLGFIEQRLHDNAWRSVIGSGLGILSDQDASTTVEALIPGSEDDAANDSVIRVLKASEKSRIHRSAWLDLLLVHGQRADGSRVRFCITGLFTSAAYAQGPSQIPILRQKVASVLQRSELPPGGHSIKSLADVMAAYPRDEIFQCSEDLLFDHGLKILEIETRPNVIVLHRRDSYDRFHSCLVYLPRDHYTRELRIRLETMLLAEYAGESIEYETRLGNSLLASVHFLIRAPRANPDQDGLNARIAEASRDWGDRLERALGTQLDPNMASSIHRRFASGLPAAYTEHTSPANAIADLVEVQRVLDTGQFIPKVYADDTGGPDRFSLRLYSPDTAVILSDALPVIENLGLEAGVEHPFQIRSDDGSTVWMHDFSVRARSYEPVSEEFCGPRLSDAFARIWNGDAENDGFNQLVLLANLDWQETSMLRACARYLRQIRFPYSEASIISALVRHSPVVSTIVQLFHARFNPALEQDRASREAALLEAIERDLDQVESLEDDRMLRGIIDVVTSTVRTSYYQNDADGNPHPWIACKIDSTLIDAMPDPRPMFEIFMCSPRVEGIHLRGGKVARGGIRWSDRHEDFRTEVLGLMKAQVVKNAVIVPVGSKGGFVVKRPPVNGTREELGVEVVACYSALMNSMLSITDNLVEDQLVPPRDVVRHDPDDPYLVVAADKGTATFSDIANSIAESRGYWLGDAFASGGSAGYDHKKMGITARGGWESVKRHFRELGLDTQSEEFTVAGIGDMAGDVFGNGMLLSPHIRLVAAFNHMHIFLDPNPVAGPSFAERRRLFDLPRSSWTDYNLELISEGGGVFERSAKEIELTDQIRTALGTDAKTLTPNQLINAILKAPVDLLWNGGIGTYVKATDETDADAADRANDSTRVNGSELKCRVVGEGGNLGMTQLGRIEYARNGGRCFTDFVDNSAGVHSSDYEVNIKILLNAAVNRQENSIDERNAILASMTEDVASLVLSENYRQTQAISISRRYASSLLPEHARFVRALEQAGNLDRAIEFLPDPEEFDRLMATSDGLCAPQICVLQAYAKMTIFRALVDSDVPEDPFLKREMTRYFPDLLAETRQDDMETHRLRREIIATHITNSLVNRAGPTLAFRVSEVTGADDATIARAFTAAREIYDIRSAWRAVEDLDNAVDAGCQLDMLHDAGELLRRATIWLIQNEDNLDIARLIDRHQGPVRELADTFAKSLGPPQRAALKKRLRKLEGQGVPAELAAKVARWPFMAQVLDINMITLESDQSTHDTAALHFGLGHDLAIPWLRERIEALETPTAWHLVARQRLGDTLNSHGRTLSLQALTRGGDSGPRKRTDHLDPGRLQRYRTMIDELNNTATVDYAVLSVAVSELALLLNRQGQPALS